MSEDAHEPVDVIAYWLGDTESNPAAAHARNRFWYRATIQIDCAIKDRFEDVHASIRNGRLLHWGEGAEGALAVVIVLDQFSRNMFRGQREAFGQDSLARAITVRALDREFDDQLSVPGKVFLCHPFTHSESPIDQDRAVNTYELMVDRVSDDWKPFVQSFVNHAKGHRDLIQRFGRFPHRNAAMLRQSTTEEESYLRSAPRYGQ
ncbi:MAG TPA: DUF924 domain-containing protein [Pseudomonadales bacterium]|nr:DUF924 domain-containing protein [Gammaproteobacteria bacterium]HIM34240.1 DUF924 domain-containing protein [Pseudomonadales bacterium]